MTRIAPIDPALATGRTLEILETTKKKLGVIPNLFTTFANSPAALETYAGMTAALAKGTLSAKVREQIALHVAEVNGCDYCLSAHAALGGLAGLTPDQIASARGGDASEPKTRAILVLVEKLVLQRGNVGEHDVKAARGAGLSDGEILEVIANVAVNVYTNYTNLLAGTEVDFPAVPVLVR